MMRETGDRIVTFFRWFLQPNPRRFLALWYSVWWIYGLKGFFVNWLIHHQPMRLGWMTVAGPLEGAYLVGEMAVVGTIAWQAWRRVEAGWRIAMIYEWYSLAEIGVSMLNPHLWTYALNQMWGQQVVWSPAPNILISHLGFVAFYAFMHHGLPLILLGQAINQKRLLTSSP